MKTFLLTLISIVFIFNETFSQQNETEKKIEIDGFYNWSMVGKNISLMVNKPFNRHVLSLGVKYHDNHFITDNRGFAYKDRFREDGIKEAVGLNLGYRFDISKQNEIVNPYLFYLLQASHLRLIRNYTYDSNSGNTAGFVLLDVTEPFYTFEHAVGVGLQTRLFTNFYLNQSAGIGYAHFYNKADPTLNGQSDWVNLLRIGATYVFNY